MCSFEILTKSKVDTLPKNTFFQNFVSNMESSVLNGDLQDGSDQYEKYYKKAFNVFYSLNYH